VAVQWLVGVRRFLAEKTVVAGQWFGGFLLPIQWENGFGSCVLRFYLIWCAMLMGLFLIGEREGLGLY
jgi:hypothetical protein